MQTAEIDEIYKKVPLARIPWNIETPPDVLTELVKSGKVRPCKVIDLGCGAGNYTVWLAGLGFDVTGVDSSPAAIQIARENSVKNGVR
jgi:2-polyprenyl-3-methyl-5-hydroxy-6-metoxy-1,4-benzoquinol methylase